MLVRHQMLRVFIHDYSLVLANILGINQLCYLRPELEVECKSVKKN